VVVDDNDDDNIGAIVLLSVPPCLFLLIEGTVIVLVDSVVNGFVIFFMIWGSAGLCVPEGSSSSTT